MHGPLGSPPRKRTQTRKKNLFCLTAGRQKLCRKGSRDRRPELLFQGIKRKESRCNIRSSWRSKGGECLDWNQLESLELQQMRVRYIILWCRRLLIDLGGGEELQVGGDRKTMRDGIRTARIEKIKEQSQFPSSRGKGTQPKLRHFEE